VLPFKRQCTDKPVYRYVGGGFTLQRFEVSKQDVVTSSVHAVVSAMKE
jgi:hypothetical protein